MKNGGQRPVSLSARLALGLSSVLLPFVVAASLGIFYLLPGLIGPLEEIVAEVTDEMEPLRHLQLALLSAGMAAQRNPVDEGRLATVRTRVDRAFDAVHAAPFAQSSERALIDAAWQEWRRGSLLRATASAADGKRWTTQLADHAERAVALLDEAYVPARREMDQSRAAAQAARTRSVAVTFATFIGALLVSLYAAVRIARPIVADIAALREGAVRLAAGELSHRITALRTGELTSLALSVNAMAERIQYNQKALSELATRDGLTGLLEPARIPAPAARRARPLAPLLAFVRASVAGRRPLQSRERYLGTSGRGRRASRNCRANFERSPADRSCCALRWRGIRPAPSRDRAGWRDGSGGCAAGRFDQKASLRAGFTLLGRRQRPHRKAGEQHEL